MERPPRLAVRRTVRIGIRLDDGVRLCVLDVRVVSQEGEERRRVELPRMEAPDACAADRMMLIGVGLLIELASFERRELATKLHQDFAGRRTTSVHDHDLPWDTRAPPLLRDRIPDERRARKNSDRSHSGGHAIRSLHAAPSRLRVLEKSLRSSGRNLARGATVGPITRG